MTTPKPAWEQIPKKPSAQGLYNQTVSQETVSPHGGPAKQATLPQKKKPSLESPKESPKKGPSTQTKQEPTPSETSQPQPTPEPKTSPGIPDTPFSSGGGNYLPHFKVGDTTYLNVLANPQIAYFVELKRKLELAWNPRRLLGEQKNRLGGLSQIVVVIGFKISSRGELFGLVTINPSLLETYDNEAKRAIRVSAPFT
ncbi:MAG: hypothetical protein HUU45_14430, partial [Leptospiraceae bacterium]|nr:hypothetical protein [Leptospiraceae bacterium]